MEFLSSVLYLVLGIVGPLIFLIRTYLLCYIKTFNRYLFHPNVSEKSTALTLKHLSVLYVDQTLVDFKSVVDIVTHSVNCGIRRVTFYDPWSVILKNHLLLTDLITKALKSRNLDHKVSFDSDAADITRVVFLGMEHGIEGLVRACKELSHSDETITVDKISDYLAQSEGILEPDLLLRIGSSRHSFLAGYPPFSLRSTEILDVPSANFRNVDAFHWVLQQFAKRDRRLGR